MAGFRLLSRARVDLLDVGAFTADQWGDDQAERYLIRLVAGFQALVDRAELRRPFLEIPPYLRALFGKHAAFYRVTPTASS
jgi:plasmid stabilization system protein ParE